MLRLLFDKIGFATSAFVANILSKGLWIPIRFVADNDVGVEVLHTGVWRIDQPHVVLPQSLYSGTVLPAVAESLQLFDSHADKILHAFAARIVLRDADLAERMLKKTRVFAGFFEWGSRGNPSPPTGEFCVVIATCAEHSPEGQNSL